MQQSGMYTNIALLGLAFLFLSYASMTLTPETLKQNTNGLLAAAGIGVSAGVEPNQYNSLAEQLSAKEAALNRRAAEQNASGYGTTPGTSGIFPIASDRYGFYSLIVSMMLLIVVVINFYYDVKRRKNLATSGGPYSVDLR